MPRKKKTPPKTTVKPPQVTSDPEFVELALRDRLDPVLGYKPGPTQRACLLSRTRYRWIGGGNRSGKTAHVAIEIAMAARRLHPTRSVKSVNGVYMVLAPSRDQIHDPWEKKLLTDCEMPGFRGRPLIPEWEIEAKYYSHGAGAPTIREVLLKNGHSIRFGVSKDPESWKRKSSIALLGIILDESEGDNRLVSELYPRLLDANSDPTIVAESGGGWILWGATQTTANPALTEFIQRCDDVGAHDWEAFRIGPEENPAISLDERERLKAALSDEDYEVRMLGNRPFLDRLSIYGKQWSDSKHLVATDYEPKPEDNLWIAYDPGGAGKESHDTGILFAAITQEAPRKVRVVKYLRLNRTTLGYDVKKIAHWLRGRRVEGFVPDPAVNKTEKATGKSVRQQLREMLIREGVVINRGLIHVHNWHEPGIKRVQTYLEESLVELNPSKESGCALARQQLLAYRSYEEGVYQGERGVVKKDDEFVDCLRYLIMARPVWVNRPCGVSKWPEGQKPEPPKEVIKPLTPDQENYHAQLQRSARMAGHIRPAFRH